MSNKNYEGMCCPVCYSKFFEDDDIVVCPDCGAPHHRDCYNSLGHCKYIAQHGTEQQWQKHNCESNHNNETNYENNSFVNCPYCNNTVHSDTLFCPKCGNDLNKSEHKSNQNPYQNMNGFGQFMMIDPLGGISPDEDLGGATAIDCASYIKASSSAIIPKFSRMNRAKKKISWNWVSFLIPEFYFLYRKCYGFAVIAITAFMTFFVLQLPMMNWISSLPGYSPEISSQQLASLMMDNASSVSTVNLILSNCGIVLFILYRVIFGMFGNYILKTNCIRKINELKNDPNVINYQEIIAIKGGVNFLAVMIGYIVIQMLTIIASNIIIL